MALRSRRLTREEAARLSCDSGLSGFSSLSGASIRAASGGRETEAATSGAAMVKLHRSANETLTTDGTLSTEDVVSAGDAVSAMDAAVNDAGSTKAGGSAKVGRSMESFVSTSDVASRTLG